MKDPNAGPFVLPPLPYAEDGLAPVISSRTLQFHHGKHHRAYVDQLNQLVANSELSAVPLEEIVRRTATVPESKVFRNAAQAWNHEFYWRSLSPEGGRPQGELAARIDVDFGGYERLAEALAAAGRGHFGSGWVWLVADAGALNVLTTADAATPNLRRVTCLLVVDVWEHAYYLDYQHQRPDYLVAGAVTLVTPNGSPRDEATRSCRNGRHHRLACLVGRCPLARTTCRAPGARRARAPGLGV
jgi:Fe-Mn family superoxide dismutase